MAAVNHGPPVSLDGLLPTKTIPVMDASQFEELRSLLDWLTKSTRDHTVRLNVLSENVMNGRKVEDDIARMHLETETLKEAYVSYKSLAAEVVQEASEERASSMESRLDQFESNLAQKCDLETGDVEARRKLEAVALLGGRVSGLEVAVQDAQTAAVNEKNHAKVENLKLQERLQDHSGRLSDIEAGPAGQLKAAGISVDTLAELPQKVEDLREELNQQVQMLSVSQPAPAPEAPMASEAPAPSDSSLRVDRQLGVLTVGQQTLEEKTARLGDQIKAMKAALRDVKRGAGGADMSSSQSSEKAGGGDSGSAAEALEATYTMQTALDEMQGKMRVLEENNRQMSTEMEELFHDMNKKIADKVDIVKVQELLSKNKPKGVKKFSVESMLKKAPGEEQLMELTEMLQDMSERVDNTDSQLGLINGRLGSVELAASSKSDTDRIQKKMDELRVSVENRLANFEAAGTATLRKRVDSSEKELQELQVQDLLNPLREAIDIAHSQHAAHKVEHQKVASTAAGAAASARAANMAAEEQYRRMDAHESRLHEFCDLLCRSGEGMLLLAAGSSGPEAGDKESLAKLRNVIDEHGGALQDMDDSHAHYVKRDEYQNMVHVMNSAIDEKADKEMVNNFMKLSHQAPTSTRSMDDEQEARWTQMLKTLQELQTVLGKKAERGEVSGLRAQMDAAKVELNAVKLLAKTAVEIPRVPDLSAEMAEIKEKVETAHAISEQIQTRAATFLTAHDLKPLRTLSDKVDLKADKTDLLKLGQEIGNNSHVKSGTIAEFTLQLEQLGDIIQSNSEQLKRKAAASDITQLQHNLDELRHNVQENTSKGGSNAADLKNLRKKFDEAEKKEITSRSQMVGAVEAQKEQLRRLQQMIASSLSELRADVDDKLPRSEMATGESRVLTKVVSVQTEVQRLLQRLHTMEEALASLEPDLTKKADKNELRKLAKLMEASKAKPLVADIGMLYSRSANNDVRCMSCNSDLDGTPKHMDADLAIHFGILQIPPVPQNIMPKPGKLATLDTTNVGGGGAMTSAKAMQAAQAAGLSRPPMIHQVPPGGPLQLHQAPPSPSQAGVQPFWERQGPGSPLPRISAHGEEESTAEKVHVIDTRDVENITPPLPDAHAELPVLRQEDA
eukprot:gene606-1033_t